MLLEHAFLDALVAGEVERVPLLAAGLTESLEIGYLISPRGRAVLQHLAR